MTHYGPKSATRAWQAFTCIHPYLLGNEHRFGMQRRAASFYAAQKNTMLTFTLDAWWKHSVQLRIT